MIKHIDRVYEILEVEQEATKEQLLERCRELKEKYEYIMDTTTDLRTQLKYQLKVIDVDDARFFLKSPRFD